MTRKEEYLAYLRSSEWRELRKEVMARANNRCEMCGDKAEHIHHIKYPKQFKNDDPRNLLALCPACHMRAHGMRSERRPSNIIALPGSDATFNIISVADSEDTWMSFEHFIRALEADYKVAGRIAQSASKYQIEKEMEQDEWRFFEVEIEGVYKTLKFINDLGAGRTASFYPASKAGKNARKFYKQLHKEHKTRLSSRGEIHGISAAEIANAAGRGVAETIGPILGEHDYRLKEIEKKISKDPDEFITARCGIVERGKDASQIVHPGRRNLEESVGALLHKNRMVTGGKESVRLGGISRIVEVNTYRRSDIYDAIDKVLGSNTSDLLVSSR